MINDDCKRIIWPITKAVNLLYIDFDHFYQHEWPTQPEMDALDFYLQLILGKG